MTFVSHLAMSGYHTSSYIVEGYPFTLTYQVSVPTDEYKYESDKKRRTSRTWVLNGKPIRSYKKLVSELKKIEL